MEAFKNQINKETVSLVADDLFKIHREFDKASFISEANKGLNRLELKDRIRKISKQIDLHSNTDQKKVLKSLHKILQRTELRGFQLWPYSQYIEDFGIKNPEMSLQCIYWLTKKFTGEFAIRSFLSEEPHLTYEFLNVWVRDTDEHPRRLVSEGTRPFLPWGKNINNYQKLIPKNLALLRKLSQDPSRYVQTSLANHINDLSRIDKDLSIKLINSWKKKKIDNIEWIANKALRNLVKSGDKKALMLMGFDFNAAYSLKNETISPKTVKEGSAIKFCFVIKNTDKKRRNYVIDYVVHFKKAKGSHSEKVFKLKKIELDSGEQCQVEKNISFKKVTTRKHYKGDHYIELQVNGKRLKKHKFNLII
jgi:3-methyladenine DNA glycosylase AlkC